MGDSPRANPLVGRFDAGTVSRIEGAVRQALRPIRNRFVNRLGVDVPLALTECELVKSGALTDRLVSDQIHVVARAQMRPSDVPVIIGLDVVLLFRLIGTLLGESANSGGSANIRPLTSADMRFGKRIIADIAAGLQEGLPQVTPQTFAVVEVSDDPRMDLGLPTSAGLFRCVIEVGPPDSLLGRAMIGIPTAAVPIFFGESTASPSHQSEAGVARVLSLPVEAVAELVRMPMSLSRVRALEVGDHLNLGSLRQIEVRVRGKRALLAEPGVKDGVRCVRVIRNEHRQGDQ